MGLLWTIAEVLVALILIIASFLLTAIVSEAYRRRHNNTHVDDHAIFEDPNSLKQVPCPHIHDPAEKYLSLVIPAFNEEYRLPGALDETINYLQQRAAKDKSFTYEVVIVDDGSADATKRVAFDFVKKYTVDNVRIILLGRNHGKGEAIRKIHAVATKEFCLGESAASDSSFRISDIPLAAFVDLLAFMSQRKWYRNFLMKGFHLVVLLTAGSGIRDTQCGFKMFTRAAARKLFTNIRLKRQV
ncbi:dolichyl-phosphate beta-glucosyltransferase-like [Populus alba x Populus x berolinensis]|nr:dolichyl-phosphate beta-glucosyltransferase-like [Populus alba x Populus x berolinensis]